MFFIRLLLISLIFVITSRCTDKDTAVVSNPYEDEVTLNIKVFDSDGGRYCCSTLGIIFEDSQKMLYSVNNDGVAIISFRKDDFTAKSIEISEIKIFDDAFEECFNSTDQIEINYGDFIFAEFNVEREDITVYWEKFSHEKKYELAGKKVLGIVGEDFDYFEYNRITNYLKYWGAEVTTSSYQFDIYGHKMYQGGNGFARVNTDQKVDVLLNDVNYNNYDMIFIPGGHGPASILEKYPEAKQFVKDAYDNGLYITGICHGPLLIAESGIIEGKNITGYFDIEESINSNGGNYIHMDDAEVVKDGRIITGNWPMFASVAQALAEELEKL